MSLAVRIQQLEGDLSETLAKGSQNPDGASGPDCIILIRELMVLMMCRSARISSAHFFVLHGRMQILRLQAVLSDFCTICRQDGAMDYLKYLLSATEDLNKTPYLLLMASKSDVCVSQLRADDLSGAVLVYEYKVWGFRSGIFTTCDFNGRRTVIAPATLRRQVSAAVCRFLVERGAHVVLLSLEPGSADSCHICFEDAMVGRRRRWWTTQTREVGATLALKETLEATLATMGKHTRRNLRYHRRRAEAELECSFASDVKSILTMEQLMELNCASTHPAVQAKLDRRYETLKSMEGLFCVGLRQISGQWISLLGGRRHHGVTEIDWQMNRSGLAKYSVGTVMRSYLIEHEIAIGTKRLFFEGGTPHPMRHSFLSEKAMDIVVMKRSPFVFLLRTCARWLHPERNFLLQTLMSPSVKWQLR